MAKDSTLHRIFCQNVRRQRETLGLTQTQVAERLGIRQPSYAEIEAGRRMPGLDVVERVAAALEVTPTELISTIREIVAA